MRALALCTLFLATPATAGVTEVVDQHIMPGFDGFSAQTEALAKAASLDCRAGALRPTYHAAFDAWMGVSHLQFGPLEQDGRNLAVAFWPDTRGMVGKTVERLVAAQDKAAETPQGFAEVSIAGRGLFALERMLFDPALSSFGADDYGCALTRAMASDLARVAEEIRVDWSEFATLIKTAGAPGNTTYLGKDEAVQALYTALLGGLEFTMDQRLGRPLGSFDRPRPNMAEARRSDRSLRNVILSLTALRDLARSLTDHPIPKTEAAFETALGQARALEGPAFDGVMYPSARLRIEVLMQSVGFVRDAAQAEIGSSLGLSAGFNSQDGD